VVGTPRDCAAAMNRDKDLSAPAPASCAARVVTLVVTVRRCAAGVTDRRQVYVTAALPAGPGGGWWQ